MFDLWLNVLEVYPAKILDLIYANSYLRNVYDLHIFAALPTHYIFRYVSFCTLIARRM